MAMKFRTGIDKHLGGITVIPRRSVKPRSAMNENEDRRVRFSRAIDIELLDLARPVGKTQRLAEPRAHGVADARDALRDLVAHRRVKALVVCRVDIDLVHVHPHARTLFVRGRTEMARNRIGRLSLGCACEARGCNTAEQTRYKTTAVNIGQHVLHPRPLSLIAKPASNFIALTAASSLDRARRIYHRERVDR
jgi:hypothetical protein